MTTWFGGGSKPVKATSETKLASIQIQTSAYGAVIPVCYGGARIPANLLWYANFTAIPNTSAQQTGKGGGGATQSNTTWSYTADVILGLCEGALDSNARFYFLWRDKEELVGAPGFDLKKGDATQAPWSRVSATRPLEAIGYGGVAYAAQLACDLGGSGAVKNHNFMVLANSQTWSGAQTGSPIAFSQLCNPIKVLNDALTNPQYGAGWPAAMLDTASWNDSAAYTDAANLRSAYAFTSASQMAQIMGDVLSSVNCRAVWSGGKIKVIPLADTAVGGWVPNTTPLYALTKDDFITSGPEDDPVKITIKPQADSFNTQKVQFINPLTAFADEPTQAEDLGDIDKYGIRTAGDVTLGITTPDIARNIAQILMQRSLNIRRTFEFKLGWRFALLEPMDMVSIFDDTLMTQNETVRIIETSMDASGDISVKAEEWPFGTASAVAYPTGGGASGGTSTSALPGSVSNPYVWEPPGDLTKWLPEIWCAIYGTGPDWGGCDVWVSRDNLTYSRVARQLSKCRMGSLTSSAITYSDAPSFSPASIFTVDISASGGQLQSVSAVDAQNLATLSMVYTKVAGVPRWEYFSYQTVALGASAGLYTLSNLWRGMVGSHEAASAGHFSGNTFIRLDENILKIDSSRWNIGNVIYLKFQSFNTFGQMLEDLSTMIGSAYTITGSGSVGMPVTTVTAQLSVGVPV